MMTYEDMDIQDRALFYYSLLTSATSEKVTSKNIMSKLSGTRSDIFSQVSAN